MAARFGFCVAAAINACLSSASVRAFRQLAGSSRSGVRPSSTTCFIPARASAMQQVAVTPRAPPETIHGPAGTVRAATASGLVTRTRSSRPAPRCTSRAPPPNANSLASSGATSVVDATPMHNHSASHSLAAVLTSPSTPALSRDPVPTVTRTRGGVLRLAISLRAPNASATAASAPSACASTMRSASAAAAPANAIPRAPSALRISSPSAALPPITQMLLHSPMRRAGLPGVETGSHSTTRRSTGSAAGWVAEATGPAAPQGPRGDPPRATRGGRSRDGPSPDRPPSGRVRAVCR